MRPISLSLNGFGSYATPTEVPLGSVALAAITGSNGSGKSTLFDAMLFALYGATRVGGRDTDAMVTLGQDQATVAFEFEVNGTRWRATRTRVRGKRTTALLEVWDPDSLSGWTARSDGTVRNTDAAIVDLLGMSLDTFLATVMVGQGDTDRFTSSDPATRKQVLGEVLGLDVFATWSKRAKSNLDEVRSQLEGLRGKAEPLMGRVAERDLVAQALADAETRANAAASAAEAADRRRAEMSARLAMLDADIERLDQVRARLQRLQGEAKKKQEAALAAQREAEQASRSAQEALNEAESMLNRSQRAAGAVPALTEEVDAARSRLAEAEHERDQLVERGRERAVEHTSKERDLTTVSETLAEKEEQARGLAKAIESGDPVCWVCEQPLPKDRAETMLADLDREIAGLRDQSAVLAREVAELDADVKRLRAEFHARKQDAEKQARALEAARDKVERAVSEAGLLDERSARVAELQTRVAEVAERAAAAAEVPVDPSVAEAEEEVTVLEERVASAGALRSAVEESSKTLAEAQRTHADAVEERGRLAERLNEIDRAAAELEELDTQIRANETEAADWSHLLKAFSKDGVPALVVASVVPELEAQANEVLGVLSAEGLMVRLATEKQTKSGTTKDTLEVAVISPDGERPYETFSGGERLRIDLALRIGLSRLLAHRSGTQMRTLVIDEGWGALDPDGVHALADCLRTLHESGEFETIYTVTHIPEIAQAFPQQIAVTRDIEGYSEVSVSGD